MRVTSVRDWKLSCVRQCSVPSFASSSPVSYRFQAKRDGVPQFEGALNKFLRLGAYCREGMDCLKGMVILFLRSGETCTDTTLTVSGCSS